RRPRATLDGSGSLGSPTLFACNIAINMPRPAISRNHMETWKMWLVLRNQFSNNPAVNARRPCMFVYFLGILELPATEDTFSISSVKCFLKQTGAIMPRAKNPYSVHPGVAMVQKWVLELPEKTGRSLQQWLELVKKSGPADHKKCREWLKAE